MLWCLLDPPAGPGHSIPCCQDWELLTAHSCTPLLKLPSYWRKLPLPRVYLSLGQPTPMTAPAPLPQLDWTIPTGYLSFSISTVQASEAAALKFNFSVCSIQLLLLTFMDDSWEPLPAPAPNKPPAVNVGLRVYFQGNQPMRTPNTDLYEVDLMVVNSSGKLLDPRSPHSYTQEDKLPCSLLGCWVGLFWPTHSLKVKFSSTFILRFISSTYLVLGKAIVIGWIASPPNAYVEELTPTPQYLIRWLYLEVESLKRQLSENEVTRVDLNTI